VGPYHNPQETYVYYSLPFCSTKPVSQLEHRWDALGEVLEGNDLIYMGLDMAFRRPVWDHSKICSMKLDAETAAQFEYAVRNHYWYQLYLDDLPIWGMVGEVADTYVDDSGGETDGEALVYTHKKFSVSFNDARIIQVNLTSENPVTLSTGTQLDFTYSVEWKPTTTSFHRRFDRYLDYDFFEHQIHWFSVAARPELATGGHPHARAPLRTRRTTALADIQFLHDGHLPHGDRVAHFDAHAEEGLRKVRA
jgi:transmembrane 9 superfamily protein 3